MSELTFNIADYRPMPQARTHTGGQLLQARSGFVVLSSNSEPRDYAPAWLASPAVVDIRSVRETNRAFSRGSKILRFSSPTSHRLYTMPAHDAVPQEDDDPGPLVA